MATIASALKAGVISEYRLPNHEMREPRRRLYAAVEFFDWVDATDELYVRNWSKSAGGRSRFEHLEQAFNDFRCARHPLVGDLNRVQPTANGIWKLHCNGLRVFGWVPFEHTFVAVCADLSEHTHGKNSTVKQNVQRVSAFLKQTGLSNTVLRGDRSALFPPTS